MRHLIGFSLSQCVSDIFHGRVSETNVLLIVCGSRADFSPERIDQSIKDLWIYYSTAGRSAPWEDITESQLPDLKDLIERLYRYGRLYQPRIETNQTLSQPNRSYRWFSLLPIEVDYELPESVKEAYRELEVVSRLAGTEIGKYPGMPK